MAAEGTKRTENTGANGGATGGSGLSVQNSAAREGQNSAIQYVSQDPGLIVRNEGVSNWENTGGPAEVALNGVGFANWNSGDGSDEAAGASARPLVSRERGSQTQRTGSIALKAGELKGILQVLGQLGCAGDSAKEKLNAHAIEKQFA